MVSGVDSLARLFSRDAIPGRGAIYLWLGLMIVVGTALRAFHLGAQPLWLDEMYSVWFSQRTWSELWTLVPALEPHSPFYYTLLKAWAWLGDYREWWLRALSVLASVLCIPVVYAVVSRMSGGAEKQTCGLAAAGALAVNPVQIAYAQDARPYALLSLAVGLALLGLASFYASVVTPTDAVRKADGAEARFTAVLVIAGAVSAAFWLHGTAPLLFGLPVLLLALGILRLSRRPARDFAWFAVAGVLVLVLCSPDIMWIAGNLAAVHHGWPMQPPGVRKVLGSIQTLLGYNDGVTASEPLLIALNVAMAAFSALGILKALKVAPHAAFATIIIVCVPIAISVLVSWTIVPIFLTRAFAWVTLGEAAAWGWFIALGRREFLFARAGVVAAVAAIAIAVLFRHQPGSLDHRQDRWPEAVAALRGDAAHTSLVVFVPNFLEFPIRWYGASPTANQEFLPMPAPFPALGRHAYPSGMRGIPAIDPADVAVLAGHAAGKERVWVVSRYLEAMFDTRRLLYRYLECSRGPPEMLEEIGDGVHVQRFGPAIRDDREAQNCLQQVISVAR